MRKLMKIISFLGLITGLAGLGLIILFMIKDGASNVTHVNYTYLLKIGMSAFGGGIVISAFFYIFQSTVTMKKEEKELNASGIIYTGTIKNIETAFPKENSRCLNAHILVDNDKVDTELIILDVDMGKIPRIGDNISFKMIKGSNYKPFKAFDEKNEMNRGIIL